MRWLAIDTSSGSAVGVVEQVDDELVVRAQAYAEDPRAHVEDLAPMVQRCLAQSGWRARQLDAIVVGTGPALFTGLRIGIATATSLARSVGCAAYGVCSLDGIALQHPGAAVVVTDARRGEVYWAGYQPENGIPGALVLTHPPSVGAVTEAQAWAQRHQATLVGPAVGLYQLQGQAQLRVRATPLVQRVQYRLAHGDLAPLTPQYLRRPDIHSTGARKRVS
ncbi:MAG: tRNA (adenosine(37)-N6)-threonylcarbamoyltransferase complex dimerization subunit type 1 TsaB [Beutenbergiaceae bacterium]